MTLASRRRRRRDCTRSYSVVDLMLGTYCRVRTPCEHGSRLPTMSALRMSRSHWPVRAARLTSPSTRGHRQTTYRCSELLGTGSTQSANSRQPYSHCGRSTVTMAMRLRTLYCQSSGPSRLRTSLAPFRWIMPQTTTLRSRLSHCINHVFKKLQQYYTKIDEGRLYSVAVALNPSMRV
jgi:hypothetical protein